MRKLFHAVRLIVVGGLLVGVLVASVPARAQNYVVCATLYYQQPGGSPQYVLNDACYVPTMWTPLTGLGPECAIEEPILICHEVTVSGP